MLHLSIEKATLLAAESRDPTAVASDRVESKRAVRIPADGPYSDAFSTVFSFRDVLTDTARKPFAAYRQRSFHSTRRTSCTATFVPPRYADETYPAQHSHIRGGTRDTSHGNLYAGCQMCTRICMSPCRTPLTARRTSGWHGTCHPYRCYTPAARHDRLQCRYGRRQSSRPWAGWRWRPARPHRRNTGRA